MQFAGKIIIHKSWKTKNITERYLTVAHDCHSKIILLRIMDHSDPANHEWTLPCWIDSHNTLWAVIMIKLTKTYYAVSEKVFAVSEFDFAVEKLILSWWKWFCNDSCGSLYHTNTKNYNGISYWSKMTLTTMKRSMGAWKLRGVPIIKLLWYENSPQTLTCTF